MTYVAYAVYVFVTGGSRDPSWQLTAAKRYVRWDASTPPRSRRTSVRQASRRC